MPRLNMSMECSLEYNTVREVPRFEYDEVSYRETTTVQDSTVIKIDFGRWHVTCAITANPHDMAQVVDAVADLYPAKTAATIRKKDLEALVAAKKKVNRVLPPHELHFKLEQYGDNLVLWFSDIAKGDYAPKRDRVASILQRLPEGSYGVAIAAGWPMGSYEDAPEYFDALAAQCDGDLPDANYGDLYTYDLLSAPVPYTGGGAELPAELLAEPDPTEPHEPRVKAAGFGGALSGLDKRKLKKTDLMGLAESVATTEWMELREVPRSY